MVALEQQLGEEEVWSARLVQRLKRAINFDQNGLITLKFLQEFLEAVFIGVVEVSLLGDEKVQSARPQKQVEMAIAFGLTVGSR